jgi:hypothetical protein
VSMLPYRPNPMTREGQEYELLEELHRNTLQAAAAAETEVARLRAALEMIRDKSIPQGMSPALFAMKVLRNADPRSEKQP